MNDYLVTLTVVREIVADGRGEVETYYLECGGGGGGAVGIDREEKYQLLLREVHRAADFALFHRVARHKQNRLDDAHALVKLRLIRAARRLRALRAVRLRVLRLHPRPSCRVKSKYRQTHAPVGRAAAPA